MALYEFKCECGLIYEELSSFDETGEYPKVSCPKCQSLKKHKLMSCPAEAIFVNPEGTKKWINSSTGHDYRYQSVGLPKAQRERAMAEQASHMGNTNEFYNSIDDISKGDTFGEVK